MVAAGASGDFVVAWQSGSQDGDVSGVFAQRFSSTGTPLGSEFQVNAYTHGSPGLSRDRRQRPPAISSSPGASTGQDGSNSGIFARRFSSAGAAQGAEFQVSTRTVGYEAFPMVGVGADGDFVVAWQSYAQDDPDYGVFARSFSSAGVALANEFQVNTYTTGAQLSLRWRAAASGNFVVAWHSPQDGSSSGIFAQRFASPKLLDIDGDGAVLPLTDGSWCSAPPSASAAPS